MKIYFIENREKVLCRTKVYSFLLIVLSLVTLLISCKKEKIHRKIDKSNSQVIKITDGKNISGQTFGQKNEPTENAVLPRKNDANLSDKLRNPSPKPSHSKTIPEKIKARSEKDAWQGPPFEPLKIPDLVERALERASHYLSQANRRGELRANDVAEKKLEESRIDEAQKATQRRSGKKKQKGRKNRPLKPAVLQIVANFAKMKVTVNNLPYPEYSEPGEPKGVVLPAGGPYLVRVESEKKSKSYEIFLRPYETRILLVDLTGFSGLGSAPLRPPPPQPDNRPSLNEQPAQKKQAGGQVIVYANPDGSVYLDGRQVATHTPATLTASNGRHDVSVKYAKSGKMSEEKIVRVRSASNVKLYFKE